jgi:hypothetical protein
MTPEQRKYLRAIERVVLRIVRQEYGVDLKAEQVHWTSYEIDEASVLSKRAPIRITQYGHDQVMYTMSNTQTPLRTFTVPRDRVAHIRRFDV